jgi:hypothetical protein
MSMRNTKLLGVMIVLQVLVLEGQWLGSPSYVTPANAQVTDPGRDRIQMIDQLKSIDAKLDKLIGILGSGNLQVKVVQPDESKGKTAAR